jgi:hypothetical protein
VGGRAVLATEAAKDELEGRNKSSIVRMDFEVCTEVILNVVGGVWRLVVDGMERLKVRWRLWLGSDQPLSDV